MDNLCNTRIEITQLINRSCDRGIRQDHTAPANVLLFKFCRFAFRNRKNKRAMKTQ